MALRAYEGELEDGLGEYINRGEQTIMGDFPSIQKSRGVEGKVGKSNGTKMRYDN